jgi:transcriptional regulator with GAF, ATPase, and Fis domain
MPERRQYVSNLAAERPETAPAAPPGRGLADRLETLRELALAFVREVDSAAEGGSLGAKPGVDFYEEVRRFEVGLICWALTRAGGNQRRAARLLNLKAATLNRLINRFHIEPRAFRPADDTFLT